MQNKDMLINSIFFPRKSNEKDSRDHLVNMDSEVLVGVRFYIKDKNYDNILYFHGNAELACEYEDIANIYNEYNINLIVADYRGYGLSKGISTKDNLHGDSLKINRYVLEYLKKNKFTGKYIIMGRSLGSASAANIIHNNSLDIDGCIIESGFMTEYSLLHLMNIDPESIQFELKDGFENLMKFQNYKKPLYIIHADMDDIVPISQADMLFIQSGSSKKGMFKVEGANHNNIIMMAREKYFENIRTFIDEI